MNAFPGRSPIEELADPSTPAVRLHELAAQHPELGPQIAAHPNCYPELQQWIAAAQASPADPAQVVQAKKRSLWKLFAIAAAVLVPLITAATIAIPFLASLGERESSLGTLHSTAAQGDVDIAQDAPYANAETIGELEPRSGNELRWHVLLDAPMETFPLTVEVDQRWGSTSCSQEQRDWLKLHARLPDQSTHWVTLHNSSSTGGALSLENIRFIGEEAVAEPYIDFNCPLPAKGGDAGYHQGMMLRANGAGAVYGEPQGGSSAADLPPTGSPVVINLDPGEVTRIPVLRDSTLEKTKRYEGRIVADLADGNSVILAEDVTFAQAPLLGFYIGYGSDSKADRLGCASPAFGNDGIDSDGEPRPLPCTLEQAVQVLREAKEASIR